VPGGARSDAGHDERVRVVVAGAGVAALEAALALRVLAEDRVEVELVAPEDRFWYRPLAVTEPFERGEARSFELGKLAAAAGATFSHGAVVSVDAERRTLHTSVGGEIPYDIVLIACGALPTEALPGALTFRGPADTEKMGALLTELASGAARHVVFAIPRGPVWPLPIYELALMTAAHLGSSRPNGVELALITAEAEPLELFGEAASTVVRELFAERKIALHTSSYPSEVLEGRLLLFPTEVVPADRVVALPRLRGPRIDGLPQTIDGFVPVDEHGRVEGLIDVFAAGDITNFSVKQGGIAAQEADAAAEAIAAVVGADVTPHPFRPVLRGLLLTGGAPRYLRRELSEGEEASTASTEALWWPPAQIAGRYLAPFLAAFAGAELPDEEPAVPGALTVEVELEESARLRTRLSEPIAESEHHEGWRVRDVARDVLVVAPEDTLSEVAEAMLGREIGSAVVAEYGRLIGILTARDLLRAFAGRVHASEARARAWMTADPVAVSADTTIETAVLLMSECGIHHLPVVDAERPVAMLGLRQAVRAREAVFPAAAHAKGGSSTRR
jgi:sulfide:quinone oxidoreductase